MTGLFYVNLDPIYIFLYVEQDGFYLRGIISVVHQRWSRVKVIEVRAVLTV